MSSVSSSKKGTPPLRNMSSSRVCQSRLCSGDGVASVHLRLLRPISVSTNILAILHTDAKLPCSVASLTSSCVCRCLATFASSPPIACNPPNGRSSALSSHFTSRVLGCTVQRATVLCVVLFLSTSLLLHEVSNVFKRPVKRCLARPVRSSLKFLIVFFL